MKMNKILNGVLVSAMALSMVSSVSASEIIINETDNSGTFVDFTENQKTVVAPDNMNELAFQDVLNAPLTISESGVYLATLPSGEMLEYKLDENYMPYYEKNGEIISIALPLEHLKIQNKEIIAYLNSLLVNETDNFFDSSTIAETRGIESLELDYERMYFFYSQRTQFTTKMVQPVGNRNTISVTIDNIKKDNILKPASFSGTSYYQKSVDGSWYQYKHPNDGTEYHLSFSPNTVKNYYFQGVRSLNEEQFDVTTKNSFKYLLSPDI